MQWAKRLYVSERAAAKKNRIMWKANHGAGMLSVYFIALASNEQNLFDIFHAAHLKQRAFYRQNPHIVGIALSYNEALELLEQMVGDIYRETGALRVREYFSETMGRRRRC